MITRPSLLVTCEHASCDIPKAYKAIFNKEKDRLLSHEGWDIGALACYKLISQNLDCQSKYARWSRLLIDLNRSLHHPKIFSNITKTLADDEKKTIVGQYYQPYREEVTNLVAEAAKKNKSILHLSIHSFCPELQSVVRNADIGLLYDPGRSKEKAFALQLKHALIALDPKLKIRMNYPYKGTADGFTTHLRKQFKPSQYSGIEIEINQKHALQTKQSAKINHCLLKACEAVI